MSCRIIYLCWRVCLDVCVRMMNAQDQVKLPT